MLSSFDISLSEEKFQSFFGRRNDDILRSLLGDLSSERINQLSLTKEDIFRQKVMGRINPLPGALDLLHSIKEHGMQQAIVSSTPRQNVDLILSSLGVLGLLDAIVSEEDVQHGKPDPQGFLLGSELTGALPEECLAIEDSPQGLAAAKAGGMISVGVATTQDHSDLDADLVINDLTSPDLAKMLGME